MGIAPSNNEMQVASRRLTGHICGLMNATQFLKTRVPAETKALIRAAAEREYVTEFDMVSSRDRARTTGEVWSE